MSGEVQGDSVENGDRGRGRAGLAADNGDEDSQKTRYGASHSSPFDRGGPASYGLARENPRQIKVSRAVLLCPFGELRMIPTPAIPLAFDAG